MHNLTADVALIVGRDIPDPDVMKPSPYLVRAAVGILDTEGQHCVFIGDSASDILAGLLAGVPVDQPVFGLAPPVITHHVHRLSVDAHRPGSAVLGRSLDPLAPE